MLILKKKIPIYFGELVVIFNDNFGEALKEINIDYGNPTGVGYCCVAEHNKNGNTRFVILLKPKTTHSCIAHESLHATHFLLDQAGHTPSYTNAEPDCYLHDWIVGEIYKFVKKNNIEVI